MSVSTAAGRSVQRGFGIVELMVAMTLSLVLLGGVIALFATSRRNYESNDHLARMQENGRFALDMISRDIRSAGYLGCAKETPFINTLKTTVNPLLWNFQFPAFGYQSNGTTWSPTLDSTLVPSASAVNSDVLVLRAPDPDFRAKRVTTLMATPTADVVVAPPAPALPVNTPVLITDCSAVSVFEVTSYALGSGTIGHNTDAPPAVTSPAVPSSGNSTASLGYAFQQGSLVMPVRTVIYYVRASAIAGNGNSLWRRVGSGAPEEVVEGVDSLQVLFGVDTSGDRIIDGDYMVASSVTDWSAVVGIRLGLLLRSVEEYAKNPDTAHNVLGQTIAAAADNRERLTLSTTVAVRNEAL